jgi:hypothetical protein
VYFLRKKSEFFEHLKDFKDHVETRVWEEDQDPPHKKWGGICEAICPSYFFRGRYTATTYIIIHSVVGWSIQEEEEIPQRDGHLHVACKASSFQDLG